MGASKKKWTEEEEAALKAGIAKHGTGKWITIVSDPEFSGALRFRSNVDLKDKWRNLNATAIWGSSSRQKAKRAQFTAKEDDNAFAMGPLSQSDSVIIDTKPIAISYGTTRAGDSKKPFARMENLILEAITSLKEADGSERVSIAEYIKDQYAAPQNLVNLLGVKLENMVENGTLSKIKHNYMIAHGSPISEGKRSLPLPTEARPKKSPKTEKKEIKILTKAQVDAELSKMKRMAVGEAAAAAARAVAEAEVAIAEAEAAAREAEAAEAEAEAAMNFAKAAEKAWRSRMVMV